MASQVQHGGAWLPVPVVVVVQVAFAAMNVLTKQVLDAGMNRFVFITYRQLVATISIGPIAYFAERHKRPKLTGSIFLLLFLSALLGLTLTQYFFFFGLQHTTATFSCAFVNMIPVSTFIIALPFGMETVNIKKMAGVFKVVGTVVCVGGAMLLTLYKGKALTHPTANLVQQASKSLVELQKGWLLGSLSLLGGSFAWSSWFIVQAKIAKSYPALYSNNAIVSLLSCIQCASFTLLFHRDPSLWALRGRLQLITILYTGAVCSGLAYIMMAWCVEKRGPLFTAAFSPLIQVVVAIIEVLFLHEQLHLGSVIGSVVVVIGLYLLLCGKSKDNECRTAKQRQAINENPAAEMV
ncbi:WAT1-related protein [Nymphaea thermarum]|nr:WAT1-related protein [Nymphaea thermarum]